MAKVNIILPTFNRANMLPDAIRSIQAQTFTDWELIVVDDGSSDDTAGVVERLAAASSRPIRYVHQNNGGVGAARATGLSHINSPYVAWLDSDDLWKPHHLQDCIDALDANPDVAWVFCAFERVEMTTGSVITPMSFRENDKPKAFFDLNARKSGKLFIIEDPDAYSCCLNRCQFGYLGTSVFRAELFDVVKCSGQRVQEDTILLIEAVARGFKPAYLDQVNGTVREHDNHACARNVPVDLDKHIQIKQSAVQSFMHLSQRKDALNDQQHQQLRAYLANQLFWGLGYSLQWQHGRTRDALKSFREGLAFVPADKQMKRFYFKARVASMLGMAPKKQQNK